MLRSFIVGLASVMVHVYNTLLYIQLCRVLNIYTNLTSFSRNRRVLYLSPKGAKALDRGREMATCS